MILYTPISNYDIFPEEGYDFSKRRCISYQGKDLFVEENDDGTYQLLKLLSTNPNDFMDATFLPGSTIKS